MSPSKNPYPPIDDYAFISDCHCTALVSCSGSIDWCCMPRVDSDSCFGRLLDWNKGGYCAISPKAEFTVIRRYFPETMILETHFRTVEGEVKLVDFFVMDENMSEQSRYDLVRIVEGISGEVEMRADICPRFDYGEIIPMIRPHDTCAWSAIGSNKGLVIHTDITFALSPHHELTSSFFTIQHQKKRLLIHFEEPDSIKVVCEREHLTADVDERLERTREWWTNWSRRMHSHYKPDDHTLRSALTLKALTFERTGAIIAAPTTALPECIGGGRNWDYRFSWVRDSVFTVDALYELGYESEAERFLQFIQRASAGSAEQLQIMYAVDGKRRLTEMNLDWLEGYQRSTPVRIGNQASEQNQLDVYGEVLEMAVGWHASGHEIDIHYWKFLSDVVNAVCEKWMDVDSGIWEFRFEPRHFVHSKAMCWRALEQGINLAESKNLQAPLDRWKEARSQIRHAVETNGYDSDRGTFVQAFGTPYLDSALLLLPRIGFVDYDDPRMVRTTDAICKKLDRDGLLDRYDSPDGLPGKEGSFLPCTFWLVCCLAYQGRFDQASEYYRRALGCANDVGLFSEEFDMENKRMLGNFPQGLTHVSQITAKIALEKSIGAVSGEPTVSGRH